MRALARLWRRSIRARIVISMVVLSSIALGLTGWVLLRAVADGLADSRSEVALSEAHAGFDQAQTLLDASVDTTSPADSTILVELVDRFATSRGDSRTFDLVVEGPLERDGESAPQRSSSRVGIQELPHDLVAEVRTGTGVIWKYAQLSTRVGGNEPVVVVGKRIATAGSGDEYAVYYVFSMAEQQQTLRLVRTALAWGGLALVLLVGAVAWIVARQVVDPLRLARRIAERFASGHLEQRMVVRGDDDIARLSTSFNQMAASLQSQIRRLENLSMLQQRFVSDVSHELRTPLTTVQMASDVLAEATENLSPQAQRASQLLARELRRFESLLTDLLALSRFDAGAAQLELEELDLAAVARSAARDPLLSRAGISARALGAQRPAVVQADPRRVARIVRNLLSNAVKYSGSDRLEIEIGSRPECVSLVVRDFGGGMSPQDCRRVFDRFWRADPARSQRPSSTDTDDGTPVGGTGLGLAISREDAALHGGLLEVFSTLGQGTEFVLTLPTSLDPVTRHAVRARFS
jgi:two-component system sensor histidine kinase MtrB